MRAVQGFPRIIRYESYFDQNHFGCTEKFAEKVKVLFHCAPFENPEGQELMMAILRSGIYPMDRFAVPESLARPWAPDNRDFPFPESLMRDRRIIFVQDALAMFRRWDALPLVNGHRKWSTFFAHLTANWSVMVSYAVCPQDFLKIVIY